MNGCIIIFGDNGKNIIYEADIKEDKTGYVIGINENNCFQLGNDTANVADLRKHIEKRKGK